MQVVVNYHRSITRHHHDHDFNLFHFFAVREHDYTALCGLVWTVDFLAYRCRTCGISRCMSLCADCFKDGNHEGHDFIFFKSKSGGACDCGDSSIMRESGFCSQHPGPNASPNSTDPPSDLMCVAEYMIPHMILRLIQHLRVNVVPSTAQIDQEELLSKCEQVIQNLFCLFTRVPQGPRD
jgi:hypothetical protein